VTGWRASEMGSDKIRYLLFLQGKWRWRPTKAMRARGFQLITFGRELTAADKARAIRLNEEWDRIRQGFDETPRKVYPVGSVGDGYERAMKLRAAERKAKGVVWTKEQESRDDWPRAWKWLDPVFGDVDPRTIDPESLLELRMRVAQRVSESEAFRVIKVWRALWKKMARLKYCDLDADPSLVFSNPSPGPRQDVWTDREAKKAVQRAWRLGYRGLAACIAVAWDSQLSPVDARNLTLAQRRHDAVGTYFDLDRAKTGRAAAATLSRWSEAILDAYIASLGFDLHSDSPIFRTRHVLPTAKGGRTWLPRPYSKDKLGKDFAVVRENAFGAQEARQLADMRRSGTVEAFAGGADPSAVSSKMANTLAASSRLQKVYNPVHVVTVRQVDEARARGRAKIGEQKPDKNVTPKPTKVSRRPS